MKKEDLLIKRILEQDYNGDSTVLGNISPKLMAIAERRLSLGIGQNIAVINIKNNDMALADYSGNSEVVFEYFWGFVYQYIYSNPTLRKKYIDSELEKKISFFNSLLGNPIDLQIFRNNKLLFGYYQMETDLIRPRGDCHFKVCVLNYQEITSLELAEYINLITRERPQLTILTEECGLKTNSTGGFYTTVGQDFHYYDVGGNGQGFYKQAELRKRL